MIASEAAQVLTLAAAYDGRTVTQENSMAWAAVLERTPLEPALEAVKVHYRSTREWMMPADVVKGASLVRQRNELEAARGASHGERAQRACPITGCPCSHTTCTRGQLDEEEHFEANGRTYLGVRKCPKCHEYAEAKASAKSQGW